MKQHVELLGWINVVTGGLGVLVGLFLFAILVGLAPNTPDPGGANALLIIGIGLGGFITVLSLPTMVAGIGLLQHKSWARVLTIILAVFALFNFPIGTLIAIYTFWVLTNEEAGRILEAGA